MTAVKDAPSSAEPSFWLGTKSWFTLYRQLFAWIVVGNLTVAIVASAGACDWASKRRVQFAVANTLVTVLTRNEVGSLVALLPVRFSVRVSMALS